MYRHFYAIAAILAVLTAASLGNTHIKPLIAKTNPQQVVVTNSNVNPVPVVTRGTVALSNDVNSPLPVRDVDVAARIPVQFTGGVGLGVGATSEHGPIDYTVPAGKTLVVQSMIADSYNFPGGEKICEMGLDNLTGIEYSIPVQDQGEDAFGHEHFAGTSTATLNFPAGSQLTAYAVRDSGTDEAAAYVVVTGYLVNAS